MRGISRRGSIWVTSLLARHAGRVAEADGNRTRQAEMLDLTGFEDRGDHQEPRRLRRCQPSQRSPVRPRLWVGDPERSRLTGYAHGGGCACKIPPGELEDAVRGLAGQSGDDVLVGLDDGDDAAAVLVRDDLAVLSTADFFTPVVDDAYDWGRIAAANALSDIYAMGGRPVVAINLVGWPRGVLPMELMTEVLRGGLAVASEAGCPVIGGHSIDDPEPKYGMAVTGVADPNRLAAQRRRRGRAAADADQAARGRAAQQPAQADRRGVRRGGRDDDRSSTGTPPTAALAAGRAGGHRRHRLRPARAPVQDVPGVRGRRGDRPRCGAGARRRRATRCATASSPAAPAATWTGCARTCAPAPASPRTTCCCWPTRRPPAGCWWSARCPGTR